MQPTLDRFGDNDLQVAQVESTIDRWFASSVCDASSASTPDLLPFFVQAEFRQGQQEQGINGASNNTSLSGSGQFVSPPESWSTKWFLSLKQSQKYYLCDYLRFPAPPVYPLLKVPIA